MHWKGTEVLCCSKSSTLRNMIQTTPRTLVLSFFLSLFLSRFLSFPFSLSLSRWNALAENLPHPTSKQKHWNSEAWRCLLWKVMFFLSVCKSRCHGNTETLNLFFPQMKTSSFPFFYFPSRKCEFWTFAVRILPVRSKTHSETATFLAFTETLDKLKVIISWSIVQSEDKCLQRDTKPNLLKASWAIGDELNWQFLLHEIGYNFCQFVKTKSVGGSQHRDPES